MAQTVKGEWNHDLIKPHRFGEFLKIYIDTIQSEVLYETLSSQISSETTAVKRYNELFNTDVTKSKHAMIAMKIKMFYSGVYLA